MIGGIALSQWGVIRVTRDIDFKVLAPDTNYDNVSSLLYKNFPEKARLDIPENPLIISSSAPTSSLKPCKEVLPKSETFSLS